MLSLLLWVPVPTGAQSTIKIQGRVNDVETGEPLPGANVSVEGTGCGAVTDAGGFYSIENLFIGSYSLQVSLIGYEAAEEKGVTVRPDATTRVDFRLRRTVLQGGECLIESRRTEPWRSDFVRTISSLDIANSGLKTVGEVLKNIPGVDVIEEGTASGRKRISIRGSRSNQVLVLLDGVPLNDPLVGDVDLSLVPVSTIEEISVDVSGASHTHGSGALGGVIDIVTKSHPIDGLRCALSLGDFQATGLAPGISGSPKNFSYSAQYERQRDGGEYDFAYSVGDSQVVQATRRNADFLSNSLFGLLCFRQGAHEMTLKANLFTADRGLPGQVHALTPYARAETDWGMLVLDHRWAFQGWRWQIDLSRYENNTEYRHLPPAEAPLADRSQPPYHTTYDLVSYQGLMQLDHQVMPAQKIGLDVTVRGDRLTDEDLLWPGAARIGQADNIAWGTGLRSDTHLLLSRFLIELKITSSLRFDRIDFRQEGQERRDEVVSPHVNITLSRIRDYTVTVKGGWGRSFRVPTFADLFYQDFRVRGNPDIKAESSHNLDVGVLFGVPLGGWLETEMDYFHRSVDNLIIWRMGSFATFSPHNTDALISGWEFSGQWTLRRDRLKISLHHMILEPTNKSGERTTHNKRLPYQADHTTKIGVTVMVKNVSLDYHRRMVGERYVTEANTVRMGPYSADDASLNYSMSLKKIDMKVTLSVFNLLDETYEMIERTPLPGRYWRGGLEFDF